MEADVTSGEDRILTVPNLLSIIRLLCVPVFLWLLFGRDDEFGAALLLAVLGSTDWVDGYIARHFGQVSNLGKILDPTADRILLLTAIVAIVVSGAVPLWVAVAALARETLVAMAAIGLGILGARRIDVTWFGKAGTFGLMFAFPLFLVSHSDVGWADEARVLAWICVIPGLVLAWYSAALYVPIARRALEEGRVSKAV
ncbi:MAG: CDP-alcohol phosphatidyltransferase family protein [Acidimicrobiia bacterium]